MKILGIVFGALCVLSMNAFAEQRIQGVLVKSDNGVQLVDERGCGIEIVYDLVVQGNGCGRAIAEAQLESHVGAVVELTGDVVEGSVHGAGGGTTRESFTVDRFSDGSEVQVIEPAPTPAQ